jgi:hypothetical protein
MDFISFLTMSIQQSPANSSTKSLECQVDSFGPVHWGWDSQLPQIITHYSAPPSEKDRNLCEVGYANYLLNQPAAVAAESSSTAAKSSFSSQAHNEPILLEKRTFSAFASQESAASDFGCDDDDYDNSDIAGAPTASDPPSRSSSSSAQSSVTAVNDSFSAATERFRDGYCAFMSPPHTPRSDQVLIQVVAVFFCELNFTGIF